MARWIIGVAALLLITSCKVRIDVPEGGAVKSSSGVYNCSAGNVCEINVVDLFFDETFTAEPSDGYVFKQWEKRDRGLCGGNSKPCRLFTSNFGSNDVLLAILASDEVFHLNPVFEKPEECVNPVAIPRLEERWQSAAVQSYSPQEELPLLDADAGTWLLGDTVSNFEECGISPHRATISQANGSRALTLTSEDSLGSCADNVFLALQELPPINANTDFAVPVTEQTVISFDAFGHLLDPRSGADTCLARPCGNTVALTLQVLPSGSELAYILHRAPDAEPNTIHDFYREIFLDPDAGSYRRNLMADLMTIPNFSPGGAEVRFIEIAVDEHGAVTLDNLLIGESIPTEDCPGPSDDPDPPNAPEERGFCEPVPAGEAAFQIDNDLGLAVSADYEDFALVAYIKPGECHTVLVPPDRFSVEITRCDIDTERDCEGPVYINSFTLPGDQIQFFKASELF